MSATVPPPPAPTRETAYRWTRCLEPLQFEDHPRAVTCVECGSPRREVALTERGEIICRPCAENLATVVVENDLGEWVRACPDCSAPTIPVPVPVTALLVELGVTCTECDWEDF